MSTGNDFSLPPLPSKQSGIAPQPRASPHGAGPPSVELGGPGPLAFAPTFNDATSYPRGTSVNSGLPFPDEQPSESTEASMSVAAASAPPGGPMTDAPTARVPLTLPVSAASRALHAVPTQDTQYTFAAQFPVASQGTVYLSSKQGAAAHAAAYGGRGQAMPAATHPPMRIASLPLEEGDILYNTRRSASGQLDSSPMPVTLALSAETWSELVSAARADLPMHASQATVLSAVRDLVTERILAEMVLWDGAQPCGYTEDVPHRTPVDGLITTCTGVNEAARTLDVAVTRKFPLSSAFAGARFRLCFLLQLPGSDSPALAVSAAFRVHGKQQPAGTPIKALHYTHYAQLNGQRTRAMQIMQASLLPLRSAIEQPEYLRSNISVDALIPPQQQPASGAAASCDSEEEDEMMRPLAGFPLPAGGAPLTRSMASGAPGGPSSSADIASTAAVELEPGQGPWAQPPSDSEAEGAPAQTALRSVGGKRRRGGGGGSDSAAASPTTESTAAVSPVTPGQRRRTKKAHPGYVYLTDADYERELAEAEAGHQRPGVVRVPPEAGAGAGTPSRRSKRGGKSASGSGGSGIAAQAAPSGIIPVILPTLPQNQRVLAAAPSGGYAGTSIDAYGGDGFGTPQLPVMGAAGPTMPGLRIGPMLQGPARSIPGLDTSPMIRGMSATSGGAGAGAAAFAPGGMFNLGGAQLPAWAHAGLAPYGPSSSPAQGGQASRPGAQGLPATTGGPSGGVLSSQITEALKALSASALANRVAGINAPMTNALLAAGLPGLLGAQGGGGAPGAAAGSAGYGMPIGSPELGAYGGGSAAMSLSDVLPLTAGGSRGSTGSVPGMPPVSGPIGVSPLPDLTPLPAHLASAGAAAGGGPAPAQYSPTVGTAASGSSGAGGEGGGSGRAASRVSGTSGYAPEAFPLSQSAASVPGNGDVLPPSSQRQAPASVPVQCTASTGAPPFPVSGEMAMALPMAQFFTGGQWRPPPTSQLLQQLQIAPDPGSEAQ